MVQRLRLGAGPNEEIAKDKIPLAPPDEAACRLGIDGMKGRREVGEGRYLMLATAAKTGSASFFDACANTVLVRLRPASLAS